MPLLRSLLYVPGNRPDLIGKIERFEADAYILDLEDGVPPSEREAARKTVAAAAPALLKSGRAIHARVNPPHTPQHREDIEAMLGSGITCLHIPKVTDPEDLLDVDHRVVELSIRWGLKLDEIELFPTIETSRAVLAAGRIAGGSTRVAGLLLGGDDLTSEWGVSRTREGREIELARQTVVVAANAFAAMPIDATYPFYQDAEGCARDARAARALGFRGKQAVHPAQCKPINEAFLPSENEIERARAIVAAAEQARSRGHGTAAAAGTQIDAAVERAARRLLAG